MNGDEFVYVSDIAFTEQVKSVQARKGSREAYALLERKRPWQKQITAELAALIATQRSFFLGTANSQGQPYIQHRGGPPGFLKVVDEHTLGFVDYSGNRQYITQGNLEENPQAFIFLIDYRTATRIKLWGTARALENQPEKLRAWMAEQPDYLAKAEQMIIFHVRAWDQNCPQHIPTRYEAEEVEQLIAEREKGFKEQISTLQKQLQKLKTRTNKG